MVGVTFWSCLPDPPSDGAAIVPALSGLLSTFPGVSGVRLPPASPVSCDWPGESISHLLSVRERLVALHVDER